MRKQAMVIGLGQFGMAVARSLSRMGVEVLAVDMRKEAVEYASTFAAEAAAFNATDEDALARAVPAQRDMCICAIGDESREGAIVVTALLRKLGARRVIARANDELLERILRLVGAHEVVNPERAFGERFATRLLYDGILEEVPLGEDLVISELMPPPAMIGRSLIELALPRTFGITVVAIRHVVDGKGSVVQPDPQAPLRKDDILVVVSAPGATHNIVGRT